MGYVPRHEAVVDTATCPSDRLYIQKERDGGEFREIDGVAELFGSVCKSH